MYLVTITHSNPFSSDIEFRIELLTSTHKADSSWEEAMDLHKLCEFLAQNYEDEKTVIEFAVPNEHSKLIDDYFKKVMM